MLIKCAFSKPLGCLVLATSVFVGVLQAQVMELEVEPVWNQVPLGDHREPRVGAEAEAGLNVSVTRLDFLMSKLALKKEDGSWVESADWQAFFSLEKGRLRAKAEGVPAGKFTAIRFDVGVPPGPDQADPNLLPPDHPLHPGVCGLHWGWQGGYVYLAIEGHWRKANGTPGGYSYHLAKEPNAVTVEVAMDFQGGGPMTVKLALDAARILRGFNFAKGDTSTHSREGDAVLPRLRDNIAQAFSLRSVKYDLYQVEAKAEAVSKTAPEGTHRYPLEITRRLPQVKLPEDNPLTVEGVALGEKLFHDPRLSINNSQSCASCHERAAAFSDPRQFSLGAEGQAGKRQAMPLFNLAWEQAFFWDGRAKTLREQVLMPIQDRHEMNETLENAVSKISDAQDDFKAAFGSDEITPDRLAKALEQYLLTLVSQESRFDRAARKVATLTEQEKRGLQLFVTEFDPVRGLRGADCFHCHGGTLFTDHQFKNNGLDLTPTDLGRMVVTGNGADKGKFKTPSLRNIANSAPYMHDGRFSSLEEVVEHYSSGVKRSDVLDPNLAKHPDTGLQLTPEEKSALVAFLKTLTDEEFIAEPAKTKIAQRP